VPDGDLFGADPVVALEELPEGGCVATARVLGLLLEEGDEREEVKPEPVRTAPAEADHLVPLFRKKGKSIHMWRIASPVDSPLGPGSLAPSMAETTKQPGPTTPSWLLTFKRRGGTLELAAVGPFGYQDIQSVARTLFSIPEAERPDGAYLCYCEPNLGEAIGQVSAGRPLASLSWTDTLIVRSDVLDEPRGIG